MSPDLRTAGSLAENPVASIFAENPVLLAPMSGITEAPFRAICKRLGAGLTYTEMVSATGLHYNPDSAGAKALLTVAAEEVPCAMQVFGSDPGIIAEQARRVLADRRHEICVVDVNMGCPVAKVVSKGEGSALMRDPGRAAEIVRRLVEAVDVPVTVKFRKGWDSREGDAVEFALAMQDAGASGVTVHGRTREQFYHGSADWGAIAAVKAAVTIPVAGSGDVMTPADVISMVRETGVDAVMVARGARGNPWIFSRARALMETGADPGPPRAIERVEMAREHAEALRRFAGARAFVRMRKHVAWYVADMPAASFVRRKANECRTHEELDRLLLEYIEYLEGE